MFARHESQSEQSFEFSVPASTLAQVCQDVLNSIGNVKTVSRTSGIITGEISNGITNPSVVTLLIKRKDDEHCELKISAVRKEGWVTSGSGAQDNIAKFANLIMNHPAIKSNSLSGW